MEGKLGYTIRPEGEKDYREIYRLIKIAFSTAKVKDGDEQDFAEGLRNGEGYIPQLALVAEMAGKLIGHIMLTKTYVTLPDGDKYEGLLLAPVSVLIEYRDMGVGSALINESFRIARELGYKAVFLCGDPAYYSRFGFKPTTEYGIKTTTGTPDQYVLASELAPGALNGITGTVTYC